MAEQTPQSLEKTIVKRVIEVDRKIAAQLYDVWVDMKRRIEKDIKTHTASHNQGNEPSGQADTASSRNHS